MKTKPLVSVIMPVYNNEAFLHESIESILRQTYDNFELLILSSEKTSQESLAIIESFTDPRILHVRRDTTSAMISDARNLGLDRSKGVYIAYMDSDDISLPYRLETQVAFMENHPDIAIAGGYAKTFGLKAGILMKNPIRPEEMKANMLFYASVVNPTAIVRKDTLKHEKIRYTANLKYCEDLDFWIHASRKVKIATIPKILLLYRTHDNNATHQEKDFQETLRESIFQKNMDELEIPTDDQKRILYKTIRTFSADSASPNFLSLAENWFTDIARINISKNIYEQKSLGNVLANKWLEMCRLGSKELGRDAWKIFWQSTTRSWLKKDIRTAGRVLKFFIATHLK
ncbi:MAG: glycosyltransferase [Patescibacteria group bacterium]